MADAEHDEHWGLPAGEGSTPLAGDARSWEQATFRAHRIGEPPARREFVRDVPRAVTRQRRPQAERVRAAMRHRRTFGRRAA